MFSKISFFYLLCIFQFNHIFSQKIKLENDFVLNCKFSEKSTLKKVYFSYINGKGLSVNDSASVMNNTFVFKGNISTPTSAIIYKDPNSMFSENNSARFYIDPVKMHMIVNPTSFEVIELKGSKSQIDYVKLKDLKRNFFEIQKITSISLTNYYKEIKDTKDTLAINEIEKKIDSLKSIYYKNEVDEANINMKFAKENLNSFVVPYILLRTLNRDNSHYKDINSVFVRLDDQVKKSLEGIELQKALFNIKSSAIGAKAPSFSLNDVNGNTVSLENLKGKCLLLDFWASWCAPCREDFPFVKELYQNNKDKGFDVVSISYQDKIEAWKKAITKENIELWINISIEENKSDIAKYYAIQAIPLKILIDKNGIIIGRWVGQSEENNKEISERIKETL